MGDSLSSDKQRPKAFVIITLAPLIFGFITVVVTGQNSSLQYSRGMSIAQFATEQSAVIAVGFVLGTAVSFAAMYAIGTAVKMTEKYELPALLICLAAYIGAILGTIAVYLMEGDSLSLLNGYLSRNWTQVAFDAIPPASAVAAASLGGIILGSFRSGLKAP